MHRIKKSFGIIISFFLSSAVYAACGDAPYSFMADDRCSDIRNTKHNFAASDLVEIPGGTAGADGRNVKAVSNDEVCVYCHTPHGDPNQSSQDRPFLWNRALSSSIYSDQYDSSSLNVTAQNVGQGSRMCLSCHDGTVAIGQVDVVNGRLTRSVLGFDSNMMTPSDAISMTGDNLTADGKLAAGTDGYTANLGTDLSNDHPLGFTYDAQLATDDGELKNPADSAHIGVRVGGGVANFNQGLVDAGGSAGGSNPVTATTRVALPLESTVGLRADGETNFVSVDADGTVECTTCHDPHIRSTNTAENIKFLRLHRLQKQQPTALATGVAEPDFSINNDINCVACHKKSGWSSSVHAQAQNIYTTDAVNLREFLPDTQVWQASCLNCHDPHTETGANWLLRSGADDSNESAIEETCFECHGSSPSVNDDGKALADIQTLHTLGGHESSDFISVDDEHSHKPLSADLDETSDNLRANRHVTCSDCHNPHRILQNSAHDGSGSDATPTALHPHGDGITHSNKLSGALNGVSGVRVDTSGVPFNPLSTINISNFTELKGIVDQGASNLADVVTKEYEVCYKCHSDYGDPLLGATKANTAIEFSEAAVGYHPVVRSSSRVVNDTELDRANFDSAFRDLGTQTMYCSDCHTSTPASGVQGPHGSTVDKILAAEGDQLCDQCHVSTQYRLPGGTAQKSGFSCATGTCANAEAAGSNDNLHVFHAGVATTANGFDVDGQNSCDDCHVKVPHGWRNRALLADTNEVDAEGLATRYYPDAKIDIDDAGIPDSGTWVKSDCTSAGCHF